MQQSKNKSLLASHDILVFFSVHWILQSFSGPREDVQDRVGRGCSRWKVQLHHETVQRKICTQPQLDFRYMNTCTHVCGNGSKWKNVELKKIIVTSIQSISLNQSYYFVWIAGVDFQTKVLEVDGRTIALQLWDTAGQER